MPKKGKSSKHGADVRGYYTVSVPSKLSVSRAQVEERATNIANAAGAVSATSLEFSLQERCKTHVDTTIAPSFATYNTHTCSIVLPSLGRESLETLQLAARGWQEKSQLFEPETNWIRSDLSSLGVIEQNQCDSGSLVQHIYKLSDEQHEVVACPRSVFIQGRAGTGKTVVLVQRILAMQCPGQQHGQGSSSISHVYVTKSSSLCKAVAGKLRDAGCDVAEPNKALNGLLCLTWQQLVQLVGAGYPRSVVTYEQFLWKYWPALKSKAGELSAQLVWAEFNTRLRPFGPTWLSGLTHGEYSSSNLSALGVRLTKTQQLAIYDMFLSYKALKTSNGEKDNADVAMDVALQRGYPDHDIGCIDRLYIDEAQDFSPCELTLLFALCQNPDGISVAGDTCQTINPGSAFNFSQMIKQFCDPWGSTTYRQRRQLGLKQARKLHSTSQSFADIARQCQTFELCCSYRCTAELTSLANSLSQLLLDRFPHSVDRIKGEMALTIGGVKPVLLEMIGEDPGEVIMGTGSKRAIRVVWAHVVFLVGTDATRQSLRHRGVQGTILTITEAKGLEFDLVVLCGILSDCPDNWLRWALADPDSEVSLMAALLERNAQLDRREQYALHESVLGIIEFKKLYVAITRARTGCAILEWKGQPSAWAPLLQIWQSTGAIECWSGIEEYRHRALIASSGSLKVPPAGQIELPSLVSTLERRFNRPESEDELSSPTHALQNQGLQLLAHAADSPQERWHVFQEARQLLLRALSMNEITLAGKINGSRFEIFQDFSESAVSRWRKQICVIVQEVCRGKSRNWRGSSTLRMLPSLTVWAQVFEFLIPDGVTEVHTEIFRIAELVRKHVVLKHQLTMKVVLTSGWISLSKVCYDNAMCQCKKAAETTATNCLLSLSSQESWQQKQDLVRHAVLQLLSLHDLCMIHAKALAEAGRAFLAACNPQLAAAAFIEAAEAAESMPAILWKCTPSLHACKPCLGRIESIESMQIPKRLQQDLLQPHYSLEWNRCEATLLTSKANGKGKRHFCRMPELRSNHACLNHGGLSNVWILLSTPLHVSHSQKQTYALQAAHCLMLWLEDDKCVDDLRQDAFARIQNHLRLAGFEEV